MSPKRRNDSRRALDEAKRRTIVALVANGCSRRVAAQYVGCAPSTITRTALRNKAFAAELHRAEQNTEIEALRALRAAAGDRRYWRAAAWILERRNPTDFARRGPDTLTREQIGSLLTQVALLLGGDTTAENRRRVMQTLNGLILDLRAIEQVRLSAEFPDGPSPRAPADPAPGSQAALPRPDKEGTSASSDIG